MPSRLVAEVVEIKSLEKHPNADSLSIVKVFDYPVIVRTEDWKIGDKAVYVPTDTTVPNREPFTFLFKEGEVGRARIKAKKLRGIFSMGLLVPTPGEFSVVRNNVGDNLANYLGIEKYEPPVHFTSDAAPAPVGDIPKYTDIEHLRRYRHLLEGKQVIVTEKIHGTNARYVRIDGVLHCGSHNQWKKDSPTSVYWIAAREYKIEEFLKTLPEGCVLYGEVYGPVQELKYGTGGKVSFAAFDIYSPHKGRYLNVEEYIDAIAISYVPSAPIVLAGLFDFDATIAIAEDNSHIPGAGHMMEGVVVRPMDELWNEEIGRVILKLHSQRYLLK